MNELDINKYCEQLTQICNVCKKEHKCKDHKKICLLKKLTFQYAKAKYRKQQKEGSK